MAGTSLDMTVPRPGSMSQVYGLFGKFNSAAATIEDFLGTTATLRQVRTDILVAIESGPATLRGEAMAEIARLDEREFVGAAGFDDWWTGALTGLNASFDLRFARELVVDKARFYSALEAHQIAVPRFMTGNLSIDLLADAIAQLGPRPVLKPVMGAGSRGVYRYRKDLNIQENLAYYNALLKFDKVDSKINTVAVEYIEAVEVSVDVIVNKGQPGTVVIHEKMTAGQEHPFVDRVMVSPPVSPEITDAVHSLEATIRGLPTVLRLREAVLHIELRLQSNVWYVLDVGVRPGMGLVGHSFSALTGYDPRLAHIRASIGLPTIDTAAEPPHPTFPATCIACCYVHDDQRRSASMARLGSFANELRKHPHIIGWHLNVSEIDDPLYRPDAGLSVGVGAPDPVGAITELQSIASQHGFSTS